MGTAQSTKSEVVIWCLGNEVLDRAVATSRHLTHETTTSKASHFLVSLQPICDDAAILEDAKAASIIEA